MTGLVGYAETPSGVLIPAATLDRLERTILDAEFRKLQRLFAFAHQHGMKALFHCATCSAPIEMRHTDQIVTELTEATGRKRPAGGGRLSLRCGCTTWSIR